MFLRKIIPLTLVLVLLVSLCGCGQTTDTEVTDTETTETTETSFAQEMKQHFSSLVSEDPDADLETLAQTLTDEAELPFETLIVPVEEGLLTGCGNTEVTGFTEGVTFCPAISTVPFLGYVFRTADEDGGVALLETLKECADPNWNVCTSADETIITREGNLVFFLMAPSSLEE